MRLDDDEAPRLAVADADEEARIAILVDHDVRGLRGADDMAENPRRPVVGVHPHVEERLAVIRPHRVAGRALDAVGEVRAGFHVAHVDGEIFRALVVHRIGHQPVVVAVGEAAEAEIGQAGRQRVAVDDDPLVAAVAPAPHHHRMLRAVLVACCVRPCAIRRRNRRVVLLDPAPHLLEQRQPQAFDVGHRRRRVVVLRFEIGADFRGQHRRLAHHLAPVVGAQPRIVVGPRNAVTHVRHRPLCSDRCCHRLAAAGSRAGRLGITSGICHRFPVSVPCRSCSSAGQSVAARPRRRDRDATRRSHSALRCAPCRASGR